MIVVIARLGTFLPIHAILNGTAKVPQNVHGKDGDQPETHSLPDDARASQHQVVHHAPRHQDQEESVDKSTVLVVYYVLHNVQHVKTSSTVSTQAFLLEATGFFDAVLWATRFVEKLGSCQGT